MEYVFSNIDDTTELVMSALPAKSAVTPEECLAKIKEAHPGDWKYQKTHYNLYPGSVHYSFRRPLPSLQAATVS